MSSNVADCKGLTSKEAEVLLAEYGKNEIPEKITPWYVILGRQFMGPMPFMIFAAALLSLIIAIIEPAGGPWPDFGICTFMLLLNAVLGFREQLHANNAAQALKERVMPEVSVQRDGAAVQIDARLLVPGDVVYLRAGQTVPADCTWLSGDPMGVDNSALNGESRINKVFAGKTLLWSGAAIKTGGGSYCKVDKTGTRTMIGEAAQAMQQGRPGKAMFQQTVETLVRYVIAVALTMVVVLLGVQLGVRDRDPLETLLACVSLLIGSVPVALPVVLTVTLALGSSKMAKEGAIVTNLTSLQEVAVMTILCSDKTGTLTTAKMTVYPDRIWCGSDKYTQDEVLTFAGLACNPDNVEDPIDSGVLRACREHFEAKEGEGAWGARVSRYTRVRFIGFDPSTKRVTGFYKDAITGKCYQIGKGLLTRVLANDKSDGDLVGAGDGNYWQCEDLARVEREAKTNDKLLAQDAFKTISVCVRVADDFKEITLADGEKRIELVGMSDLPMYFAGILPMRDPPRHDTTATIRNIRSAGVEVKMITGDHHDIAIKTSEQINLGVEIHSREKLYVPWTGVQDAGSPGEKKGGDGAWYTRAQWDAAKWSEQAWNAAEGRQLDDALIERADGFAQVIPTDKFNVIKSLQHQGYVCGMTGDGVNDAAALSAANCGIAVKGAVDAARAASDILLTEGGLSPIYSAIYESRCIFQRLRSYVIYRIGHSIHVVATLAVLILGFDYVIDPLYVILMALFNDLAITMIGFDNAIPTTRPSVPRTATMLALAFVAGIIQSISSIVMFKFGHVILLKDTGAISAGNKDWDIAPQDAHKYAWQDGSGHGDNYISTILYLQMATTAGLLMFSTRTRRFVLSGNPPQVRLVIAILLAFVLSLFMSAFKTIHQRIEWADIGIVWLYNLAVALLVEIGKLVVIRMLPEDDSDKECCGGNDGLVQLQHINAGEDAPAASAPLINDGPAAAGRTGLAVPSSGVGPLGQPKLAKKGSLRASLLGDHGAVEGYRADRDDGDVVRKGATTSAYDAR